MRWQLSLGVAFFTCCIAFVGTIAGDDSPLELTISLVDSDPDARWAWNSPLPAVIALRNVSDEPVTVLDGDPWGLHTFQVEGGHRYETIVEDGVEKQVRLPVEPLRYFHHMVEQSQSTESVEVELAAGEALYFELNLTRCFNVRNGLRFEFVATRVIGMSDGEAVTISSEPLEVVIHSEPSEMVQRYLYPEELLSEEFLREEALFRERYGDRLRGLRWYRE
jgi:hypothetical protein